MLTRVAVELFSLRLTTGGDISVRDPEEKRRLKRPKRCKKSGQNNHVASNTKVYNIESASSKKIPK